MAISHKILIFRFRDYQIRELRQKLPLKQFFPKKVFRRCLGAKNNFPKIDISISKNETNFLGNEKMISHLRKELSGKQLLLGIFDRRF